MNRRSATRRIVAGGLVIAIVSFFFPSARVLGSHLPKPTHSNGSALVVLSGADAVTLDPMVSLDGQSPLLWRATYESLLAYDGPKLHYRPLLASSWSVSKDGLTYIFHIRPGVTFSDGTPLDAAAVKLSIGRLRKLNQGASYAFSNVTS